MNPKKCTVCFQAAVVRPEHEPFVIQLCAYFQEQVFPDGIKHDSKQNNNNASNLAICSRCRISLVRFAKLTAKFLGLVCKTEEPRGFSCEKTRAITNLYRCPLKTGPEIDESAPQKLLWNGPSDRRNSEICRQSLLNDMESPEDASTSSLDDESIASYEEENVAHGSIQIDETVDEGSPTGQLKPNDIGNCPTKTLSTKKSSADVKKLSERDFIYRDKYPFQRTDFGFKCGSCPIVSKICSNKALDLWFNVMIHIRKWHMGDHKVRTGKMVQKCIKVAPNRFQYGEYFFEKIDGKYQCGVCGDLKHARAHKDKIKYITKHIVEEHEHPSRAYVCEYCGVVYKKKDSLRTHKITKHEQPDAQFPCSDCDKIFKTRAGALVHHNQIHRKIYNHHDWICEICGKKCWSKSVLQDHVAFVHNGEKMKCKDCGKMFASQLSLNTHRRSHNGKKYTCDICGMDFTQHYSVTRHKKTAHEV